MTARVDCRYNPFRHLVFLGLIVGVSVLAPVTTHAAENYQIDPAHTSITFRIQHAGISWVQGRFNEFAGAFTIDANDAGKSSFEMTIKTASVDTNVAQRDQHLRTADFFDVEKYPEMVFKSTAVRNVDGGLEVTGDFTLHGVTQPVTFTLSVTAPGYGTIERAIALDDRARHAEDFVLTIENAQLRGQVLAPDGGTAGRP